VGALVRDGVALAVDRVALLLGTSPADTLAEDAVVGSPTGTCRVKDALPSRPRAAGVPATRTASAARAALIIERLLEVDAVL
jgi:hypothetical protein